MHGHSESTYDRICYKQPLNNLIYTPCDYYFETNPFCHASTKFTLSVKDLETLAEFNSLQNLHLCTQKSVRATNFGPL